MVNTKEKPKADTSAATVGRKGDIMQVAEELFRTHGYEKTSVNLIVETTGVAKGTFYHYFKTKEDILSAIVHDMLDDLVAGAEIVASDSSLSPLKKLEIIFSSDNNSNNKADAMKEGLHLPENRMLHEKINVQLILRLSPIVAGIVDEGVREGKFKVTNTLETVQFLMAASQFLFDEGLFTWSASEWQSRRVVMQQVIEMSLGAPKGSFEFIKVH